MRNVWGVLLLLAAASSVLALPLLPLNPTKSIDWSALDQLPHDRALVYFGSPLCGDQCPLALSEAAAFFFDAPRAAQQLNFLFVDLDQNSLPETARQLAHSLHPSFLGLKPQEAQVARLRDQFGLNLRQTPQGLNHRGRLYLLERQESSWRLSKAFEPNLWNRSDLAALIDQP